MILLLLLLSGDAAQLNLLEIPGNMNKPQARWEDLNGDGAVDIWVRDGDEQIWIWDGALQEARLRRLPFDPISLEVRPHWSGQRFEAAIWLDGYHWVFDETSGWTVPPDAVRLEGTRPGLVPLDWGPYTLMPTFEGYLLMEGNCVRDALAAIPASHLQARRLRLIYPVPEPRDLDQDGREDLIAAPISLPRSGKLRVWRALRTPGGWDAGWQTLQFPHDLSVSEHRFGDLNGDGFDDLVVIAAPAQEMSLFEEMTFMVYLGLAHGSWETRASQVLKTRQNLWQNGPVEVDGSGITLYYYKGLIRTIFKIDRYRWDPAGFIRPQPDSIKWTLKDGSRSTILTGHDLNGDGLGDLVLAGQGIFIHYRQSTGALPFREQPDRILADKGSETFSIEVNIGEQAYHPSLTARINGDSIRREGRLALVTGNPGETAAIWTLFEGMNGFWYLKRLD